MMQRCACPPQGGMVKLYSPSGARRLQSASQICACPLPEVRCKGPPPGGMVKLYSPSKRVAMQRSARPPPCEMVKLYSPAEHQQTGRRESAKQFGD